MGALKFNALFVKKRVYDGRKLEKSFVWFVFWIGTTCSVWSVARNTILYNEDVNEVWFVMSLGHKRYPVWVGSVKTNL